MSKKIGITIITDIDELISKIDEFVNNFSGNDALELPHIFNALNEWEQKNSSLLTMDEYHCFCTLKDRIENLMNEFQISL